MKYRVSITRGVWAAFIALFLCVQVAGAKEKVRVVEWSPHGAHYGCQMNMGPTGVRVWMRGYDFQVVSVDAGSPADGVLVSGDRIIGVGKTMFSDKSDSRMALGNAIGNAEADDGKLKLTLTRDGRKKRVEVVLPVRGAFAKTWPYDCEKSQRILDEACMYLRDAQLPNGVVQTDGGMGTYLSGLLFLSTGESRFLDCARRAAYAVIPTDYDSIATPNWSVGYGGLLLGEYYLATGDTNVLGKLQEIVDWLAKGQMQCGSWGHDSPSAVYGAMNQAGIVCAIAMSLGVECGLDVDRESLAKALNFYGRYAELGAVPYGDHGPGSQRPDDNGKSSSTAILCSLHKSWRKAADIFAASVSTSYWLRETGHTGGFFSMTWGPLACVRAGKESFRKFMDYQEWYYNLCRTWRGALVLLPYYEALTRFDDSGYNAFGGEFTSGGLALAFALPHRKLRILGAPRSVFGADVGGAMRDARTAYQEHRYDDFRKLMSGIDVSRLDDDQKSWYGQLKAAAEMLDVSTGLIVREIDNDIEEGDPYRASVLCASLERAIGEKDERLTAVRKRLQDGGVQWKTEPGRRYYESLATARSFWFQTWFPYSRTAKELLGEVPDLRPCIWEVIVPVAPEENPREWRREEGIGNVSGDIRFKLDSTDCSALRIRLRAPRNSHTKVFLNGEEVAEIFRGQRSGYAKILLDDSAKSLLRKGDNEISLEGTSVGRGKNALDVGLDGVEKESSLSRTPSWNIPEPGFKLNGLLTAALERTRSRWRGTPLNRPNRPDIPERLRVRDSHDRFQSALVAVTDEFDEEEMNVALKSPVAYWRYLAARALSRRGDAGLARVVEGLKSPDWRERSACCDALITMSAGEDSKAGRHPAFENKECLNLLVGLMKDKNAWVRANAARALGAIGKVDLSVGKVLAAAAGDPDVWVRSNALGAIDKVTDDHGLMLSSVSSALKIKTTSFGVASRANKLIGLYGAQAKSLIPALMFAIENPGEGMGSVRLKDLMSRLVEIDAEGKKAVPVLVKVAKGGYEFDRLQGNPRKLAIELLGEYGKKAAVAVHELEAIANSDEKRNASCRDAAAKALELIRKK